MTDNKRGLISRADLLELLARDSQQGGNEQPSRQALADSIGFAYEPVTHPAKPVVLDPSDNLLPNMEPPSAKTDFPWTQFEPEPTRLWRAVSYRKKSSEETAPPPQPSFQTLGQNLPQNSSEVLSRVCRDATVPLTWRPLADVNELHMRLRRVAMAGASRWEVDIPQAVDRLSRGEWLSAMPRRPRKVWGHDVLVVLDRSERLMPYWRDGDAVADWLESLYPTSGFVSVLAFDDPLPWVTQRPVAERLEIRELPENTLVVAATDLGLLAKMDDEEERSGCEQRIQRWLELGRQLRDRGNQPVAMFPGAPSLVPTEMASVWNILTWDARQQASPATDATYEKLLDAASAAVRLEPHLVRRLRELFPDARWDAGLESRIWQSELVDGVSTDAATVDYAIRSQRAAEGFATLDHTSQQRVFDLLFAAHGADHPSVWLEEALAASASLSTLSERMRRHLELGLLYFLTLQNEREQFSEASRGQFGPWLARVAARLAPMNGLDSSFCLLLEDLLESEQQRAAELYGWQSSMRAKENSDAVCLRLSQHQGRWRLDPVGNRTEGEFDQAQGSVVADLIAGGGRVRIKPADPADPETEFWGHAGAPAWVRRFGRDEFGCYATFQLGDVESMLRWIPPGEFRMGSTDEDSNAHPDEKPTHQVRLSSGFWMLETPVIQQLWEAICEQNPSKFRGPHRPVESVAWKDCGQFCFELGAAAGLEFRLPTEAQWEYACRAGASEVRYGELDAVAWHGGNSEGETHDVKRKQPNAWGLYDTLGNIWEFCADSWYRQYDVKSGADPYWDDPGASDRVLRGGSWYNSAGIVRAAVRFRFHPDSRDDYVGFRCLSSSEPSPQVDGGEGEWNREADGTAFRRSPIAPAPRSGAQFRFGVEVRAEESHAFELPAPTAQLRVETDHCEIALESTTLPHWASAFGRDSHGLWADFTLQSVTQRLRWIPPGELEDSVIAEGFWMFDTPCTQALWLAVMEGENPSEFQNSERQPVERVSWHDANGFCERLTELLGVPFALPDEMLWVHACRAGTSDDRYGPIDEIAWYVENSDGNTHPVKGKRCNTWGLYDMLGNVWEWCSDAYGASTRVVRGGSWDDSAEFVRAAFRGRFHPDFRNSAGHVRAAFRGRFRPDSRSFSVGFRCLSSLSQSKQAER